MIAFNSTKDVMLEADGLSKFYGELAAVRGITFHVPRGHVCALLGPRGAGKSTTIKMLTGRLAPCEGHARIAGYDVQTNTLCAVEHLGLYLGNDRFAPEVTPRSYLSEAAAKRWLYGGYLRERLEYVASTCSLKDMWDNSIAKLPLGDQRRVEIAQALLHDPAVLILDEPTKGLRRNEVDAIHDLVTNLGQSKTILLSTDVVRDVQAVCDRVVLINDGRLIFAGDASKLGNADQAMEQLVWGKSSQVLRDRQVSFPCGALRADRCC